MSPSTPSHRLLDRLAPVLAARISAPALLATLLCGAPYGVLAAQDPGGAPQGGGEQGPPEATAQQDPRPAGPAAPAVPQKFAWPRDEDRTVCRVGGKDYSLGDLVDHLTERHDPLMRSLMPTDAGRGFLESPIGPTWVRQYADVLVLEIEAKRRGLGFEDVEESLGAALQSAFQAWLNDYVARRESRGQPLELTQKRVNLLLSDFQRRRGLGTEVQGWLDALVEPTSIENAGLLREYYNVHPRYFGGALSIQQIFVRHRDAQTLELLRGEGRRAAYERLDDIRKRLDPSGANFDEIARRFSEDTITAGRGGLMEGIERFDDRLPAALCRIAWNLRDGQISEPFESQFGIHIVRRLEYKQLYYVLFTDQIKQEVADTMRKDQQETLLWKLREEFGVDLRY